jgi:hypothetical protein
MPRAKEIYIDGQRFPHMKAALDYIKKMWGKGISYLVLTRTADLDATTDINGKQVKISWKAPEEKTKEPETEAETASRNGEVKNETEQATPQAPPTASGRSVRINRPLLRYPPGCGPLNGNRGWH